LLKRVPSGNEGVGSFELVRCHRNSCGLTKTLWLKEIISPRDRFHSALRYPYTNIALPPA
jgi:hypothetical protein